MKIYSKLLALCVFHMDVWGTTAFVLQTPTRPSSAQHAFSLKKSNKRNTNRSERNADRNISKNTWDVASPITIQGSSLRTWSFPDVATNRVQVLLQTEGRPLQASVDLWQGPDNSPQKMSVYLEDGSAYPFSCVIETPNAQNSIAIRNTAQLEFPLSARVEADVEDVYGDGSGDLATGIKTIYDLSVPEVIQGGSIKTFSFSPYVERVQVLMTTDGRPLNARIELLHGPNSVKQVIELYTEDGIRRPFFATIETPDAGSVVRVKNIAPMEYPLYARVVDFSIPDFPDLNSSYRNEYQSLPAGSTTTSRKLPAGTSRKLPTSNKKTAGRRALAPKGSLASALVGLGVPLSIVSNLG